MTSFLANLKRLTTGMLAGWRLNADASGGGFVDSFRKKRAPNQSQLINEYRNTAFACANLNARAFASVGYRLYATSGQPGTKAIKAAHRGVSTATKQWMRKNPSVKRQMAQGQDVVEITDHPVLDLLEQVNDELDGFSLLELTDLYQEVTGTAYWYMERGNGSVLDEEPEDFTSEILLLPSQLVRLRRDAVKGMTYTLANVAEPLNPEQVLPFRFPNLRDPYGEGWSPLRACLESVDLMNADLAWANSLMENQARPDVWVTPKEGGLDTPNARRLERKLNMKFRKGGGGGVLVTEEDINITPLSFNSKQLELLARKGVTKVDIANAFDVPIPLLEAQQINRATLEGALYQHAKLSVLPRATRFFQRLNAKFLPSFDSRLFLWFDNPVPEDEVTKAQVNGTYLDKQVTTINEVREGMGLDTVPWGETPWQDFGKVQLAPDGTLPAAEPATGEEGDEPTSTEAPPQEPGTPGTAGPVNVEAALPAPFVTAATNLVMQVVSGTLPRDAGIGLLVTLMGLTTEQAESVMGSAGTDTPTNPNPKAGAGHEQGREAAQTIAGGEGGDGSTPPGSKPPGASEADEDEADEGDDEADDEDEDEKPVPPAKAVWDALVGFRFEGGDRKDCIAALTAVGVPYGKAFEWTMPVLPVRPDVPEHDEKAPGGKELQVGRPGLQKALKEVFAAQRAAALKKLGKAVGLLSATVKTFEIELDMGDWDEQMAKKAEPFIELGFEAGGKDFYGRTGVKPADGFAADKQPHVRQAIKEASFRFSKATNGTTSLKLSQAIAKLRQDLADGILGADTNTPLELTRIVQRVFDEAEFQRAERIAMTESSRAVHGGQVLAAKESGVVTGFKWLLSGNACPICKGIAQNTPEVKIGEAFGKVSDDADYGTVFYPPAHPYCQCSITEVIDPAALADKNEGKD